MQKVLYLLVLALSVTFFGCAPPQYKCIYTNNPNTFTNTKLVIPIYIDKEFTMNDKLSIDDSINQWNYVLNQQIILTTVDYDVSSNNLIKSPNGDAFFFLKVNSQAPDIPDVIPDEQCRKIKGCKLTLAWTDKIGGNTVKVVRDRFNADDLKYIMLHEIGHLLRLTHSDNKHLLMFDTYSKFGYLCIDQDATNKVAQAYNLEISQMNYCFIKF